MADKVAEASASASTTRNTIKLDSKTFWKRVKSLYDSWQKKDDVLWKGADSLVIASGLPDDDNPYKKTNALQTWLLGYEFADTILVFCETAIYVFTSAKKVAMLEAVKEANSPYELRFLTIAKAENAKHLETLFEAMKKSRSGKSVGVLLKEKMLGPLGTLWEDGLEKSGLFKHDVTPGFSDVLAVKDANEIKFLKQAAETTSKVMTGFLIPAVETVIDEETQKSHSDLADEMEEIFAHPEKINPKLANELVESCYIPIIQSGGKYDLKLSATNNSENLHFGTIVCALGARYKGYCSNVARTFFIDPKKEVEVNYRFLLEVYPHYGVVVRAIKPGVKISTVMEKAVKYITAKRPELVDSFLKCCGYGIGIEFQETYLILSSKNTRAIKPGMVFNILVGFQNLELKEEPKDAKNKVYSMMLADTVLVGDAAEQDATVLTSSVPKGFNTVSYFIEEEQEKDEPAPKKTSKASVKAEPKTERDDDTFKNSFDAPRFRDNKVKAKGSDDKMKKHQEELAEKIRERRTGLEEETGPVAPTYSSKEDLVAYSDPSKFPPEVHRNKIFVDVKAEVILLPIYGYLVPFHISIVKNASKTDDYLRINFVTPTQITAQSQAGGKEVLYVREVTYRIQDQKSLTNSLRLIKELRKRVSDRENAAREQSGLISQDKLILSKNRNPRLADLFIRPSISGHRTGGALEAHVNGFRFSTSKSITPCDHEQIILIHFHLHHPIMVGKKKTKDVQFCTEVMEASSHLDGRASSRDEIEDEQAEAELRNKLNKDFQSFVKRVEDVSAQSGSEIEFDIPFRELGFYGVPFKSNVFLQPSVHCLVSLIETPFFVLTLKDVEICNFERVSFGLRNFDMVFVLKDYNSPVARVNNIPVDSLEAIKEWLDECNIKFYEQPTNLNWPRIMTTIKADVEQFFKDGGWSFLEDKGSDDEVPDSESESDFEPESSAEEEEESDEEYESDDSEGSASDDSGSDDDDEDEEDEEGEDWEELERKAAAEDREKKYDDEGPKRKRAGSAYSDDEEEEKPKAKKPATTSKSSNGKPTSNGSKSSSSSSKPTPPARPSASSAKPSSSAKPKTAAAKPGAKR